MLDINMPTANNKLEEALLALEKEIPVGALLQEKRDLAKILDLPCDEVTNDSGFILPEVFREMFGDSCPPYITFLPHLKSEDGFMLTVPDEKYHLKKTIRFEYK